ncbi:MAG: hypothetical protein ABSH24_02560 [Bryobacteraceae bacterium]|jgi:hypothetical protein
MIKVRRVPAILLLFVVGFLPIAPALLVDAESTLPACCRRGGKHHCGMSDREMADMADTRPSGAAMDALRASCPFFPRGGGLAPNPAAALLGTYRPTSLSTISQAVSPAQTEAGYRWAHTSYPKRGPPSLLS